ncbi:MAG: type II toxin-antitoxin system PemK/MazF family toxin [Pyrinomonadaceae bacterium]
MVERFDVYLVSLDEQVTKDPKNTRPCVVVSPDEMNRHISNVIIAPLSAASGKFPTRIVTEFLNSKRMIVLDQIRTVDKARLVKKIGTIDKPQQTEILDCLAELFAD